jgi:hypothetical protein
VKEASAGTVQWIDGGKTVDYLIDTSRGIASAQAVSGAPGLDAGE